MNLPQAWLSELATLALATSRIAGLVVTSPFPGKGTPTEIKVGMVFVFGYLAASTIAPVNLSLDLRLAGLSISEVALGLTIGLTFRITFSCAEMVGSSFSQSLGLTQAHVFDPMLESDDGVPGRIATMLAMLLVFSLGAHRVAIAYVLQSFHALPVGQGFAAIHAVPLLVDYTGSAIAAGVRLGLPVAGVALAVQITLALIARASPSMQIFSVGMALSVGAGMLAVIGSIDDVSAGIAVELGQLAPRLEHVLEAAGAR
ncbi:MAG: Flagellar biosynthesis protein FliR [Labilithrix sp.]|nr:Flagellar biosynthesis protein FliR [Labilithrix sp.]